MREFLPFRELQRTDQVRLLLLWPLAAAWVILLNLGTLIDAAAQYWFTREEP
jgi:hypothetical protein